MRPWNSSSKDVKSDDSEVLANMAIKERLYR